MLVSSTTICPEFPISLDGWPFANTGSLIPVLLININSQSTHTTPPWVCAVWLTIWAKPGVNLSSVLCSEN